MANAVEVRAEQAVAADPVQGVAAAGEREAVVAAPVPVEVDPVAAAQAGQVAPAAWAEASARLKKG